GTFTDVTRQAGLLHEGDRWGTGCTFVDFDRDGNLDLFVSNYLRFDPKVIPPTGKSEICNFKGVPVNCGPRGLRPETSMLYRNNGNGAFTDISVSSGIAKAVGSYGLTTVAADFDGDGWPEIYVACDSTPSLFFKYNKDGTFTENGIEMGVALNEDGQEQAGMGLGIGDFTDISVPSGIAKAVGSYGLTTVAADFDGDGWPEIYVACDSTPSLFFKYNKD